MSEDPRAELETIKRFYDTQYYANAHGPARVTAHHRRLAARLGLSAGMRVLDVACGRGEWLLAARQRGAAVAGIDLSDRAIESCRLSMPEGHFAVGPAEILPFEDRSFDLVTCLGSLEHFVDKPGALSEMRRVGTPEARFVLLVPNAGFLTRRLGFYSGTNQKGVKEDVLSLGDWSRLFDAAGLQVRERWADLHPLSWGWVSKGPPVLWPVRALQALALATWPLDWQYQVYFLCQS
jgi:SAM-dependent methyltransferase